MKMERIQIIFLFITIMFFQACSVNKADLKSIAQTNSAVQIEEYKIDILKELIRYKKKLDLRNPNSYNKDLQSSIIQQITKQQDFLNLVQNGKKLENYNDYFYYAFSEENINNRNDLLILGLYKLIYVAYSMEKKHQFSALQYNQYEMLKLYQYLQVVRWKIRTARDKNGNYLFNTWQNNWQLELEKKYNGDYRIIKDLVYIKSNTETIFDHSNFTFETTIAKMLSDIEHTLRKINIEPYEMGVSTLKTFVFIL